MCHITCREDVGQSVPHPPRVTEAADEGVGHARAIRVLVVEDEAMVGEIIQGMLEDSGYTIVGRACNGREAVEMTQSLHPDVILMDIEMPGMGGIEATRRIQERCPTPVVILSAYETPELLTAAGDAGAGAYLRKPPDAAAMTRAIVTAMARFRDVMVLREMNAELRARNQELDAFASTVAHDIKHPLTLIVGYADLLAQEYSAFSEEEVRAYLRMIAERARKVGRIVDTLLLLAQTRQKAVAPGPLDMHHIVTEVLRRRVDEMIRDYQAQIVTPERWPVARGYAPWVEEIWTNYIGNAIKYGGRPPYVQLGFTLQGEHIRFWVRDNGAGLTAEEQARLFIPFERLRYIRTEGYGLGLSIVRRIAERLGGEVGVESEKGQGACFWFTLPAWVVPTCESEVEVG